MGSGSRQINSFHLLPKTDHSEVPQLMGPLRREEIRQSVALDHDWQLAPEYACLFSLLSSLPCSLFLHSSFPGRAVLPNKVVTYKLSSWNLLWGSQAKTLRQTLSQCPKDSQRSLAPTRTHPVKAEEDCQASLPFHMSFHVRFI